MTQPKDLEDIGVKNKNEVSDEILKKMVNDILSRKITTQEEMDTTIQSFRKKKSYGVMASKRQFFKAYREICTEKNTKMDQKIINFLQTHPVRSESGVMVIAVGLDPYPNGKKFSCDWDCWYCPNLEGFPRSYLPGEPGIDRANQFGYDPVLQMFNRLESYNENGHPTDKLEIIVLGGTWASYPEDYQYDFITKLYYAANVFYDEERRPMKTLQEEIKINETAECKIIGLTLETRPDCINSNELRKFREMGVTRIQLGVQHINDRVLERINRACPSFKTIQAIKMLKDNCFKVDTHWMPDLPKPFVPGVEAKDFNGDSNDIDWDVDMYEEDKKMFDYILSSPDFQADQWKIYAFQVTSYSRMEKEHKAGLHKSYVEEKTENGNKLIDLLLYIKEKVPEWIRVNRVIRDIPTKFIQGGCPCPNLNQYLIDMMKKQGKTCRDIRSREVRDRECDMATAKFCVRKYEASGGTEYFLSYESQDEKLLYGFLRLRITDTPGICGKNVLFDELVDCALIRELHVYGKTTSVGNKSNNNSSQHIGFGTRLLQEAEKIALENGFKKIAVISGVGVRDYYRKRGYEDGNYFLVKNIEKDMMTEKKNNIMPFYYDSKIFCVLVIAFLFAIFIKFCF
jgi:elongator complex protein 3